MLVAGGCAVLLVIVMVGVALTGQPNETSNSYAGAPTAMPAASGSQPAAAPGRGTSLTPLPAAPPLDQWVVLGNDFQRTVDLEMRTAMIQHLGVRPADASDEAARSLAYHLCSALRGSPPQSTGNVLAELYPSANSDMFASHSMSLAARGYCVDATYLGSSG